VPGKRKRQPEILLTAEKKRRGTAAKTPTRIDQTNHPSGHIQRGKSPEESQDLSRGKEPSQDSGVKSTIQIGGASTVSPLVPSISRRKRQLHREVPIFLPRRGDIERAVDKVGMGLFLVRESREIGDKTIYSEI